jgi:hypothetical protein
MFAGSTLGGWSRIPVFPQSLSCVMASACVGRDLRYGLRWAKVGSVIVRRQVVRTSTGLMGTVIAVQENGLVLVRLDSGIVDAFTESSLTVVEEPGEPV